jgi:hypothetical protein
MVKQLLQRIPVDDAPLVAAWYVYSPAAFYAQAGHPVGLLLRDIEKLHTEWSTGRRITADESRRNDATFSRMSALAEAFVELENEKRIEAGTHDDRRVLQLELADAGVESGD